MSASQEKEKRSRTEKKTRESSGSKNPKAEDANDRRPIITQEKIPKQKTITKERGKSQGRRTEQDVRGRDKGHQKKPSKDGQEVGAVNKTKRVQSVETKKYQKDSKVEAMYLKDLLEKRGARKTEAKMNKKMEEGDGKTVRSRRDRTRTRTLSPTEVKQLVKLSSKGGTEMADGDGGVKERGRRKGEKEDEEKKKEEEEAVGGASEEEYEDDFEDYNSDFEEESNRESDVEVEMEVEEGEGEGEGEGSRGPVQAETAIDPWKTTARRHKMEEIKKCIEKENEEVLERRKSLPTPKADDSDKEKESKNEQTTGQLIDFSKASKRLKKAKKAGANRKRGEELLNMITLDTISYSILEIPPIPYEDFMRAFGKANTMQAYVQTNEDDLDEEVQTDEVEQSNKWTQNPAEYLGRRRKTKMEGESFALTREERLGVGGDVPWEEDIVIRSNAHALWKFLSWASQLVVAALERKTGNLLSLDNMPNHSRAMVFGDGFVGLNVGDVPFLKGRSVSQLSVLPKSAGKLLSVHVNREKSFQKCMMCVWSFRELSKPLKILLSSNQISSCCFGLNQGNLVFAGLADGSVCLWDLREPCAYHNRTPNSPEWSLQSPTYTTAGNLRDCGHRSAIVAVRLLSKADADAGYGDFTPMQICSLDKNGTVIIWTVVQLEKAQRNVPSEDLGLAHWGRVKLVKSSTFSVFASLRDEIPELYITCNDILINEAEDDGFYVANSLGSVHHCSAYGSLMKPKFYVPSKQDAIIETTCLELCPFNANYFLVGCGDGTIRLHSRHQENPLICLNATAGGREKEAEVVSLSWMRMRPCVFFALDSLSRINIWDLGVSDMYPEISLVLTEKRITCMRLLPIADPRQVPFMVIGTEGGSIEIHKLKKEYGCRTSGEVHNEMKMFLKYVSIL